VRASDLFLGTVGPMNSHESAGLLVLASLALFVVATVALISGIGAGSSIGLLTKRRSGRRWFVYSVFFVVTVGLFTASLVPFNKPWAGSKVRNEITASITHRANLMGRPEGYREVVYIAHVATYLSGEADGYQVRVQNSFANSFTVSIAGDSLVTCLTWSATDHYWRVWPGPCSFGLFGAGDLY
jgi:hypothetical protein